jgi:hypothetical protein
MVRAGAKEEMIMKRAYLYLTILPFGAAVSSMADDVPKRFAFERYQVIMDRSPFAVATAVSAPAATPDFAKDLYVANAAKSPDGDMVTIASGADKNFKKYLTTKEPVDGYGVASIEWSDKVGATKVTISKDGKFATLTFNQALLAQPASNAPPAPAMPNPPNQGNGAAPPAPGAQPQTNYPRPAPVPSLPIPRIRGVIRKDPQMEMPVPAQQQQQQQQPPPPAKSNDLPQS